MPFLCMNLLLFVLFLGAFPESFEHAISARCTARARVFAKPAADAVVIGIVEPGNAFPIYDVLRHQPCPGGYFLQIAPEHYVCSSFFIPWSGFPVRRSLVLKNPFEDTTWRWRKTTRETQVFTMSGRTARPTLRLPENSLFLLRRSWLRADDGRWMLITGLGWAVPGADLEPALISRFRGRELLSDNDLLWALVAGRTRIPVQENTKVQVLPDRTWVRLQRTPVLADAPIPDCFPLEDGGCIDAKFVHAIAVAPTPKEITGDERWIEVNIANQTLTAYQGHRPVYFTLVSTGRRGTDTVPGNYCIHYKRAWQDINKKEGKNYIYYYESIPYIQFYRGVFAFHPSVWHDAYGSPHSRGCIEMSLADAAFLYFWTLPQVPDGYLAIAPTNGRSCTRVRIVDTYRRPWVFSSP